MGWSFHLSFDTFLHKSSFCPYSIAISCFHGHDIYGHRSVTPLLRSNLPPRYSYSFCRRVLAKGRCEHEPDRQSSLTRPPTKITTSTRRLRQQSLTRVSYSCFLRIICDLSTWTTSSHPTLRVSPRPRTQAETELRSGSCSHFYDLCSRVMT